MVASIFIGWTKPLVLSANSEKDPAADGAASADLIRDIKNKAEKAQNKSEGNELRQNLKQERFLDKSTSGICTRPS